MAESQQKPEVIVSLPTTRVMVELYQDLSNRELALLWLEKLNVNKDATKLLLPIIADEFRRIRRDITRSLEKQILKKDHRKGGVPVDLAAKKRLLNEKMYIGIGRTVLVADATLEDWQARKEFLSSQIVSLKHSIERCDIAIDLLKYYNVNRLGDIPENEIPEDLGV